MKTCTAFPLLLITFSKQLPVNLFVAEKIFYFYPAQFSLFTDVSIERNSWDFSGLLKVAASEEGFCSSPYSVVNSDTDSNTLYWKVTNPTLSPPYLRGQY